MGPKRRTGLESDGVHAQHPVVEEVSLHDAAQVNRGPVIEDPRGPSPAASRCRTRPRDRSARPACGSQMFSATVPRAGAANQGAARDLGEGVGQLVAPDEGRPQRVVPDPVLADEQPAWRPR